MATERTHVTAGSIANIATLKVEDRVPFGAALQFRHTERAFYQLRYLPDTDEVALIRGDEIIYSEPVPQGPAQVRAEARSMADWFADEREKAALIETAERERCARQDIATVDRKGVVAA